MTKTYTIDVSEMRRGMLLRERLRVFGRALFNLIAPVCGEEPIP